MKTLKSLCYVFALLFVISCNQLNLKNSAGSLLVSLPGTSSRIILSESETVKDFKDIGYKVSLCTPDGKLVEEKTANPGDSLEFSEVEEGKYTLVGMCHTTNDAGIAAGVENVEVKAGEITSVDLTLLYNKMSILDTSHSGIVYTGPTKFSQKEWKEFADKAKNYVLAELIFTNGYADKDKENLEISDPVVVKEDDDLTECSVTVTYSREGKTLTKDFSLYIYKEKSAVVPGEPLIIDKEKSSIQYSGITDFDSQAAWEKLTDTIINFISVELFYTDNSSVTITSVSGLGEFKLGDPVETGFADGKTKYTLSVAWVYQDVKLTKDLEFSVAESSTPTEPTEPTEPVVASVECATWSELATAVANAEEGKETTLVLTGTTYAVETGKQIEVSSGKKIHVTNKVSNVEIYLCDVGGLTSFFEVNGNFSIDAVDGTAIILTTKHNMAECTLAGSAIVAKSGSEVTIGDNVSFSNILTNTLGGAAINIESGAECNINGKVTFNTCKVAAINGMGGAIYSMGNLSIEGKSSENLVKFLSCSSSESYGGAIYIGGGETSIKNAYFNGNQDVKFAKDIYFVDGSLSFDGKIDYLGEDFGVQLIASKKVSIGETFSAPNTLCVILPYTVFNTYKNKEPFFTGSISDFENIVIRYIDESGTGVLPDNNYYEIGDTGIITVLD